MRKGNGGETEEEEERGGGERKKKKVGIVLLPIGERQAVRSSVHMNTKGSLSRPLPPCVVCVSLCMSVLSQCVSVSLCHAVSVSLCHAVSVSLCLCVTLSLTHLRGEGTDD
jgi:hypothetical protein